MSPCVFVLVCVESEESHQAEKTTFAGLSVQGRAYDIMESECGKKSMYVKYNFCTGLHILENTDVHRSI